MSRTVLFVLYEKTLGLDVVGPMDVFTGATSDGADYQVLTASIDGLPVRLSNGLTVVPDCSLADADRPHTLVVPGGEGAFMLDPRLVEWLGEQRPSRLVSVCTGAFALAAAGLLNERRATTHWAFCPELARRYPRVLVDPEPIFVRDGDIATSAGVTAGIDLSLALVEEDFGREMALALARRLVVFLRRPGTQAQFSAQLVAQTAQREPLREVQHWISEHPGADLSVESLAARAQLSPRHFARAFRQETGVTPGRYVDQVRIEHARRLLEDSIDGVDLIARSCGYGTSEAMRRAFVKTLGTAPAEYRRRFRCPVVGR